MVARRNAPLEALNGCAADPLAERDDDVLMTLAAADRRDAFGALVGRYLPRLARYCAKFVGSSNAGEEVAQEILLEAWGQRRRYRPSGRFPVFIFTIARSRCLNHLRAERRRRRRFVEMSGVSGAPPTVEATPDQLDVLLEEERRRQVRTALLDLPAKLREVVLLRFDQGLDYVDVARIVGRPEATVRSRVRLAILRLRDDLAEGSEP